MLNPDRATVLIDGPSGAGKSTIATQLATIWPGDVAPELVRMDDIYPGWHGLDAASAQVVRELLLPRSRGAAGRWLGYDWVLERPTEWRRVDPARPVILEGCGALSRGSAPLATLSVWVDADDERRKQRALERDNGAFDAHWDMWDAQFRRFVDRERPHRLADLLMRTDAVGTSPNRSEPR